MPLTARTEYWTFSVISVDPNRLIFTLNSTFMVVNLPANKNAPSTNMAVNLSKIAYPMFKYYDNGVRAIKFEIGKYPFLLTDSITATTCFVLGFRQENILPETNYLFTKTMALIKRL